MDGEPEPSDAPEASGGRRAETGRAFVGGMNVIWSLFVGFYGAQTLITSELEAASIVLSLLLPAAVLQAISGFGIMRYRTWAPRLSMVVLAIEAVIAVTALLVTGGEFTVYTATFTALVTGPAAAAALASNVGLRDQPVVEQRLLGWVIARDVLGAGNVIVALGIVLLSILASLGTEGDTVLAGLALAVCGLFQLIGGSRLISKRPGARALIGAAALGQLAVAALFAEKESDMVFMAMLAAPSIGTMLCLLHPSFRPHLKAPDMPRKLAKLTLGALAALLCIWFVAGEAADVKKMMREQRYETECEEDGNTEACGRVALSKIRGGESDDVMREGRNTLDKLCFDGNAKACRFAGYVRTVTFADFFQSAADKVVERRGQRAREECEDGDATACAVALHFADERDVLMSRAEKHCRAKPSVACHAWALRDSENEDAWKLACEAGFSRHCVRKPRPKVDQCLDGRIWRCSELLEEDPEVADADIYTALLAVHDDPGYYTLALGERDYAAACDAGSVPSCIAAGRALLGPLDGIEAPELPPRAELDATFGRACDAGAALGCLIYGTWLLDRPLDQARDIKRANELLTLGCEQGNHDACRMRVYDDELLAGEVKPQFDQMRDGCTSMNVPGSCDPFYRALAGETGLTPWTMSDELGLPWFRKACLEGDTVSCTHLATLHTLWHGDMAPVPSLRYLAMDAAGRACRAGSKRGCEAVLFAAETWWPSQEGNLEAKICGQIELERCSVYGHE